jgi:hypothetical protein
MNYVPNVQLIAFLYTMKDETTPANHQLSGLDVAIL